MSNDSGIYYQATTEVEKLRVPELKNVLRSFSLSTTGRKQELINRVRSFLNTSLMHGESQRLSNMYNTIMQQYSRALGGAGSRGSPSMGSENGTPIPPPRLAPPVQQPYTNQVNSINRPPHQQPTQGGQLQEYNFSPYQYSHPQMSRPPIQRTLADIKIKFKVSPFYKVLKPLHDPILFEKAGLERRTIGRNFLLTGGDLEKVTIGTNAVYILSAQYTSDITSKEALLQFPTGQLEMRVNNKQIVANTRGIKGIPGSALPVDITSNAIEVYNKTGKVRHTLDVAVSFPKEDYILNTYLVEPISIDTIIKQIQARSLKKEDTIKRIQEDNDDDDLVATTTFHSLRDPVTFQRIEVPIRSTKCTHIDPVDARSFLELQLQGSTWKCTICNKVIDFQDLSVDEYFQDILQQVPTNADEVEINPNGAWVVPRLNDDDDGGSDSDSDEELAKRALKLSSQNQQEATTGGVYTAVPHRESEPIVVELSDDEDEGDGGRGEREAQVESRVEDQGEVQNEIQNQVESEEREAEAEAEEETETLENREGDRLDGDDNGSTMNNDTNDATTDNTELHDTNANNDNTNNDNDDNTISDNSEPDNNNNNNNNTIANRQLPEVPNEPDTSRSEAGSVSTSTSLQKNPDTSRRTLTLPSSFGSSSLLYGLSLSQRAGTSSDKTTNTSTTTAAAPVTADQNESQNAPSESIQPSSPESGNSNDTSGSSSHVRSMVGLFNSRTSTLLNPQPRTTTTIGSENAIAMSSPSRANDKSDSGFPFSPSFSSLLKPVSQGSDLNGNSNSKENSNDINNSNNNDYRRNSVPHKENNNSSWNLSIPQRNQSLPENSHQDRSRNGDNRRSNSTQENYGPFPQPRPQPPIPSTKGTTNQQRQPNQSNTNKRAVSEVIDLTLSDDDESPPAKR